MTTIREGYQADLDELRRIAELLPDDQAINRLSLVGRLDEIEALLITLETLSKKSKPGV